MRKQALTRVGRLFFGRPLRLYVAAWILEQGSRAFYQKELLLALHAHGTASLGILNNLIELRMVERLPKDWVPGHKRVYYRRLDHPLWDAVLLAAQPAAKASAKPALAHHASP